MLSGYCCAHGREEGFMLSGYCCAHGRVEGFLLSGYCCAHGREEGRGEQGGGVYAEWLLLCPWEEGRERGAGWRGL